MNWTRHSDFFWENHAGYRIAAAHVRGAIRYGVFAPPIDSDIFKNQTKTHYAIGEPVPQEREALGCFDDPDAARDACERHSQMNLEEQRKRIGYC